MRAYVMTTGIVFALLVLAHLWRLVAESGRLLGDPVFLIVTLGAAALGVWAARLLRRRPGSHGPHHGHTRRVHDHTVYR